MLTQEYLKTILNYNKETGIFTRLRINKYSTRVKIEDKVGTIDGDGYRRIYIFYKHYLAHRLAWLYVYGELPKGQIDHLNGIRDDNRIENLRNVTSRENNQNRYYHRNGKLVGCYYNKIKNNWISTIRFNNKNIKIGEFCTELEAHRAYLKFLDDSVDRVNMRGRS